MWPLILFCRAIIILLPNKCLVPEIVVSYALQTWATHLQRYQQLVYFESNFVVSSRLILLGVTVNIEIHCVEWQYYTSQGGYPDAF